MKNLFQNIHHFHINLADRSGIIFFFAKPIYKYTFFFLLFHQKVIVHIKNEQAWNSNKINMCGIWLLIGFLLFTSTKNTRTFLPRQKMVISHYLPEWFSFSPLSLSLLRNKTASVVEEKKSTVNHFIMNVFSIEWWSSGGSWILTAYSSTERRITWKNVCKTQGTKAEQHTGRLVNYYEIIMFKLGQKREKKLKHEVRSFMWMMFSPREHISQNNNNTSHKKTSDGEKKLLCFLFIFFWGGCYKYYILCYRA